MSEGGVAVNDAAVRRHREQPLRQGVVVGKRRLEPAQRLELAVALARDVGNLSQGHRASTGARLGIAANRNAQATAAAAPRPHLELLLAGLAALGRAVEAEERLRRGRLPGEQLLKRAATRAGEQRKKGRRHCGRNPKS